MTTLHIDFGGIPLVVEGSFLPAEPSVGATADFVIYSITSKGSGGQESVIAQLDMGDSSVHEYLRDEAIRIMTS